MAIEAPKFCKDAVPSLQGWRHATTGELLKSQRISQGDIDAWNAAKAPAPEPKKAAPAPQPVVVEVTEEPVLEIQEPEVAPAPAVAVAAPKPVRKTASKKKTGIGARIKAGVQNAADEVKDALD